MSEETALPIVDPGTSTPDASAAATTEAGQTVVSKDPVPFERWDQTNKRMKEAEAKLAELAKAEDSRKAQAKLDEEARLAEGQKYQELAEKRKAEIDELSPLKDKAIRYAAALTSLLETERKGLAKHILELLDKMDPADQLEYIAKNKSVLNPGAVPNINGASTGQGRATYSDAEAEVLAGQLGIDAKYIKNRAK